MTYIIDLPEDLFTNVERAAADHGLSPAGWIDAIVPEVGPDRFPRGDVPPRTLADLFHGLIGPFSSGAGEPRLETLPETFREHLEEKHRAGRL